MIGRAFGVIGAIAFFGLFSAAAADWTYQYGDERASRTSAERVEVDGFGIEWVYDTGLDHLSAWGLPARYDAYHNRRYLYPRRNYDVSPGLTAAGGRVYVACSAAEAVLCLDAAAGKLKWSFPAGGPVRMAPVVARGKVYFGSDDGYLYCLDAASGRLLWRFSPRPRQSFILADGLPVSRTPCRSGVVVYKDTVFCAFSFLPWEATYLCAVDADRGIKKFMEYRRDRLAVEGGAVLWDRGKGEPLVVFAQSRVPAVAVSTRTGKLVRISAAHGGFIFVSSDGKLVSGPNSRDGNFYITDANMRKEWLVAGASRLICAGEDVFVLGKDVVRALMKVKEKSDDKDKKKKKRKKALVSGIKWEQKVDGAVEFALAGKVLFVGGRDVVAAFDTSTGKRLSSVDVEGTVGNLAVAGGKVYASTDSGKIYCLGGGVVKKDSSSPAATEMKQGKKSVVDTYDHPALLYRWVFFRGGCRSTVLGDCQVFNPVFADQKDANVLTLKGPMRIENVGEVEALVFDGRKHEVVMKKQAAGALPKEKISVEAWVRLDAYGQWGGIFGNFEDNGGYERGVLLGYRGRFLCFAVSSRGAKKLTYLAGRQPFVRGRWYHVVGTYDGKEMRLYVNGKQVASSREQAGPIFYDEKSRTWVGAYHDVNEFFPMKGSLHELCVYGDVLSAEEVKKRYEAKRGKFVSSAVKEEKESGAGGDPAIGPVAYFRGRRSAVVWWRTSVPCESAVLLTDTGKRFVVKGERKEHRVAVEGLLPGRVYRYVVKLPSGWSARYRLDTTFNHSPYAMMVAQVLPKGRIAKVWQLVCKWYGLCLLVGVPRGSDAAVLASLGRMRIVAVDTNYEKVRKAAADLLTAGLYGKGVWLRRVMQLEASGLPADIAGVLAWNLDRLPSQAEFRECLRLLRPYGGTALLPEVPSARRQVDDFSVRYEMKVEAMMIEGKRWLRVVKGTPRGAADWRFQYGDVGNSGFSGETLYGARSFAEMDTQWVGRPSPRFRADRNGRGPSPLAAGGVLVVQGDRRLMGLDAYTGIPLWFLSVPGVVRFDMPHDCSNMCVDGGELLVTERDHCLRISLRTGRVLGTYGPVTNVDSSLKGMYWGYVAAVKEGVMGSAVTPKAIHTTFWGGRGWYDGARQPKVLSDALFMLDRAGGRKKWLYKGGAIVNSTISIDGSTVFFLENANKDILDTPLRSVESAALWKDLFLVAVSSADGKVRWKKPLADVPQGKAAVYAVAAEGTVVLSFSRRPDKVNKNTYAVYAFDQRDGRLKWRCLLRGGGGHGAAMSRVVIKDGIVFSRLGCIDLASGKRLSLAVPAGKCGNYVASAEAFFFRNRTIAAWNPSGLLTRVERVRPDCWQSFVPACGLLLAPEGGGGCSCLPWYEISAAFHPVFYTNPAVRISAATADGGRRVSIYAPLVKGEIRYTLDGSEPTASSQPYRGPFRVGADTRVIKARVFVRKDGSAVAHGKTVSVRLPVPGGKKGGKGRSKR